MPRDQLDGGIDMGTKLHRAVTLSEDDRKAVAKEHDAISTDLKNALNAFNRGASVECRFLLARAEGRFQVVDEIKRRYK